MVLAECLEDEGAQRGATWLLKHYLEQQPRSVDAATIESVYSRLEELVHWEAKLHVLQCIPYMPVPAAQAQAVETFVRSCLRDQAKFVRAWAYNGFCELARLRPGLRGEAMRLFERALDESPLRSKRAFGG